MRIGLVWFKALVVGFTGWAHAESPSPGSADVGVADSAEPAEPVQTSGYDKGFFLRTPDDRYALKIQGRVQTRYALESLDTAGERETEQAFSVQRARLTLKGHVHSKDIRYKFQSDFGKGSVVLKDFFVDYSLPDSDVRIRAGQWKRPFSRQQITSSGKLELVDRAITDKFFGNGRDIGVAVHNNYEKSPSFEWVFGVFNGTGDKPQFDGDVMVDPLTGEGEVIGGSFSNVPSQAEPAFVGRVGYNHNGIAGYSEADLEGGPLRFAVGASALAATDIIDDEGSSMRGELDYALKAYGMSTTGGVYVSSTQNGDGMMNQGIDAVGAHVQVGYVIAETVQPSLRFAVTSPEGSGNDVREVTGALSLYSFSHNFKWQTDASLLRAQSPEADASNLRVRTQLQLAF